MRNVCPSIIEAQGSKKTHKKKNKERGGEGRKRSEEVRNDEGKTKRKKK